MKTHTVSSTARNLGTQALISLVFVLPFVSLELINWRSSHEGFPVMLFALMWVLTFSFILILMPIVQGLRANTAKRVILLPKVVLLIVIASIWVRLVVDQMPCFLGFPNCD